MRKAGLLGLVICLLLTGCGGSGGASRQSEDVSTSQSQETVAEAELSAGELALGDKPLHVEKVETAQFQEPEEGYTEHSVRYKVLGNSIYMLRIENAQERWGGRLCVQIYDADSKKTQLFYITPKEAGQENAHFVSADLTAGRELSLKLSDGEETASFSLVRMSLDGDVLRAAEPFPEEGAYPWNKELWESVGVFDLSDGRTVLGYSDMEAETTRLTWYEEETGTEAPLGTLDSSFVSSLTLDGAGVFYYLDGGDCLVRWNVEKNTREELFRLYVNGIETGADKGLICGEEGELLLCCMQGSRAMIYTLTDKESPDKEKIQLCSLQGEAGIGYFQRLAATFTQNGGEVPISMDMEKREEYQEDYRTRIMAEMMSGAGPDILYVTREDMLLMQERGMLCDLTDMIEQETKEVLIPGVLELGRVNGELVGLVPEVSFITLGTGNKVWAEDGWSVEELARVLETDGGWEYPFEEWGSRLSGEIILLYVFCMDPEKTGFLDMEQGTARFDSQEFIEILELCKKYGAPRNSAGNTESQLSVDERTSLMREGQIVAEIQRIYGGLDYFSMVAERYGEEAHFVGFPVESGSGNYVDSYSYGYLVVNAQTKYKEEISKFFAQLLDYDNQFKTNGGCVRLDVIQNSIYYSEWDGKYYMLRSSDTENHAISEIGLKPDGTPYLEEYIAFVESCEPQPYWPPQIRSIAYEEIVPFFEGSKSAGEAADVIQRRVQLYLEETR